MGAFDTYEARARCPRCGEWHWPWGQTKFWAPEFVPGRYSRHFSPGASQPIDGALASGLRQAVWEGEWVRMRAPCGDEVNVLADFDDLFTCECGAHFAIVLDFRAAPGTATLERIRLIDIGDPASSVRAAAIDFASAEGLWCGSHERFDADVAALAARPIAERMEWLEAALRAHFTPSGPDVAYNQFAGAVCEACGRSERARFLFENVPWLFDAPSVVTLRAGTRFETDLAWLDRDVDRGAFVRLRHPLDPSRLTLLGAPQRWGCSCGAGRASLLLRFERDPEGVTLRGLRLRVVRGRADYDDVDFVNDSLLTRWRADDDPRPRLEITRERVLESLVARIPRE